MISDSVVHLETDERAVYRALFNPYVKKLPEIRHVSKLASYTKVEKALASLRKKKLVYFDRKHGWCLEPRSIVR